ncbi:unnamed protein product, partial [Ilex paraguariensis]
AMVVAIEDLSSRLALPAIEEACCGFQLSSMCFLLGASREGPGPDLSSSGSPS